MSSTLRCIIIAILLIATACGSVSINWASDININNSNEDSSGELLTGDFIFELGSFGSGFIEGDKSTWAAAWKALDRVRYNEEDRAFGKMTLFSQNTSDFPIGRRVYIWGFRPSGPVSEWILISDPTWVWPNASSPLSFPRNWLVASASQSLIGMINLPDNQLVTEVVAEATPLIPWLSWQTISFEASELLDSSIGGVLADPDQDGLANQLEYFLGSNPKVNEPLGDLLTVTLVGEAEQVEINFSPSAALIPQLFRTADFESWQEVTSLGERDPPSPFQLSWLREREGSLQSFFQLRLTGAE